ncbi:MAG: hypothetical protein JNL81_07230 [Hyphomonadaceae bacterium]|nr:hypothetical protein [Hyphomonadaceae bacterium]
MTTITPAYDVLYDVTVAPFEPYPASIVLAGLGLGMGLWAYMYSKERWHRAHANALIVLSLLRAPQQTGLSGEAINNFDPPTPQATLSPSKAEWRNFVEVGLAARKSRSS